ncbi:MAG: hypothetical protein HUU35_15215, partial [Armatimonadetes bacterium]|nr:hypothetical protein [Armatimonadota bacterium]
MYRIRPRHLFVMAHALTDPHAAARLDRLLAGLGRRRPELVTITPEELPEVITRCGWIGEVRQGAYHEPRDPDLLFTAFHWLTPEQRGELTRSELFARCHAAHTRYGDCGQNFTAGRIQAMLGAAPFFHFERREQWQRDLICWSLHDIHTAWGCLHRCAYCQRGSVYVINLNVEEFGAQVDRLLTDNPWQKTIRYDVEQDVLAIEPEYGACELLVNQFARYDDRYLMLFTKSANVGHLLRLEHRGHTIMLWTLTPRSVSRRYEARTGSMDERLAAARRCQEAGYPIRFKCKPIIPTRGWRAEMTEMLEAMYAQVQPENLSAEVVFFDSVAEMDATLGLDQLDPEFVEAARVAEAAPWSNDLHGPRPFPFEVKRVI